jgi:phosphatidylglycerol:prolipoprotein diacylglycerol transferase
MKLIYWTIGILAAFALVFFVFVPAFQGTLIVNPVIQFGNFAIRWYGIILAASILLGFTVMRKNSWKFGISSADVDDFSFWAVLLGILGARVYYVIFSWPYFLHQPAEIYKLWHGGLSIYGAVLAGTAFGYFYSRRKAYGFWQLADLASLALPLSQALGRLGNFINQEAYGGPTNLPWKMYIAPEHRLVGLLGFDYFHPAFLYEALGSIAIFWLLSRLAGRLAPGNLFLIYLMSYSLVRFFVEGIRVDSFFIHGVRVDQAIAAIIFIAAGVWLWRRLRAH